MMTDEQITNTARQRREHVELAHATGVPVGAFVPPEGIEAQEAAGQTELVLSDLLPYPVGLPGWRVATGDVTPEQIAEADAPFVALGFTFGDPVDGDPLFRKAKLPDGWRREGSDHSMWSFIVDPDGYRRVGVFYKAAFYDRRADMHIESLPRTKAQADAWDSVAPDHDRDALWMTGRPRREGPNYVYAWRGRYGANAPEGKHEYSDDGRRLEVEVAPDGSVVERRQFTTEPDD